MTQFEDSFSEEVWRTTYKYHEDTCVDDTFRRVAKAIASVEKTEELKQEWEDKFFDMLNDFKVTPGGRIYSNAGTGFENTGLANCYVGPSVKYDMDSLAGIMQHLDWQTKTLASEGGWGENFSYIRPRGAHIKGIGVDTPGAVKFMEMFDKSSEIVTSGSGKKSKNSKAKGKIRKGAMMGCLDCWHPDVIEFITSKQQHGRLTKFNISVNFTDEFMERLLKINDPSTPPEQSEELDKWDLIFPDTTHPAYKEEWDGIISNWKAKGYPVIVYETVSVRQLWNLVMESTYNRAEPGVLFLDRANHFNAANYLEKIKATNPCGEQVLAPGGICCLGSVNLTQFLDESTRQFDIEQMKKYVKYLVRFLDNVNEYSWAPLPEYIDSMRNKRRIGCGVLGWGSLLFMMKIRFASDEAIALQTQIMQEYAKAAYEASIDLAVEKGKFTYCDPEKHAEGVFVNSIDLSEEYIQKLRKYGIRNSSLMSQQPTGNTSITANICSGGIEPLFMPEYVRTAIVPNMPEDMVGFTPKWFEGEWYETEVFKETKEGDEPILKGVWNGVTYKIDKSRGLTKETLCEDYGVRWLKKRGEWDANAPWAVTTTQLSAQDHITDLKGFARYTDSACSKTVNIPNDYPYEAFKDLYLDVYKTGYIKGFTTYRAGTMTAVLAAKEDDKVEGEEVILDDVKLPDSLPAVMKRLKAEGKKWYVTTIMNEDSTAPMALFVHTNHPEKNTTSKDAADVLFALAREKGIPEQYVKEIEDKVLHDNNTTKIARAISLNLRHGVRVRSIVTALDKVENTFVGSFLFTIKKYLSSFIKDGEKVSGVKCAECGSDKVIYQEGCQKCVNCGSSKCG